MNIDNSSFARLTISNDFKRMLICKKQPANNFPLCTLTENYRDFVLLID